MNNLEIYKRVEQERYDSIASIYDSAIPKDIDLSEEKYVQFRLLKEYSSAKRYDKVLELACGTGRYFDFVSCKKMFGLDLSLNMLRQANKKKFNKPVFLVQADIFHIPFHNNSFDLVYSIGTLGYHAPVTVDLLREVKRVLKQGGTFIFTSNVGDRLSWKNSCIYLGKDIAEFFLPILPSFMKNLLLPKLGFGRFTHTKAYLTNLLKVAGFSIKNFQLIMPNVWPQYYIVTKHEKRREAGLGSL